MATMDEFGRVWQLAAHDEGWMWSGHPGKIKDATMTAPPEVATNMTTPHGLDPAGPDLTVTQVAELLHVDRRTVIRYINDGAFPGAYRMPAKLKGAYRVPRAAVLPLIQGRRP